MNVYLHILPRLKYYAGSHSFDKNGTHYSLDLATPVGEKDVPKTLISYIRPKPWKISDLTKRQITLRTPNLEELSAEDAIKLLLSRGRTLEEIEAHPKTFGVVIIEKEDIDTYKEAMKPQVISVEPEEEPKKRQSRQKRTVHSTQKKRS